MAHILTAISHYNIASEFLCGKLCDQSFCDSLDTAQSLAELNARTVAALDLVLLDSNAFEPGRGIWTFMVPEPHWRRDIQTASLPFGTSTI